MMSLTSTQEEHDADNKKTPTMTPMTTTTTMTSF